MFLFGLAVGGAAFGLLFLVILALVGARKADHEWLKDAWERNTQIAGQRLESDIRLADALERIMDKVVWNK